MIECPDCHLVSHHPVDERVGWCANCERFTSKTDNEVRVAAYAIADEGDLILFSTVLYRLERYGAAR